MKFIDSNNEVITLARDLMEKYSLHPRDAIHAASTLYSGAEVIMSDDSDFDKVRDIKRILLGKYSCADDSIMRNFLK